MIQGRLFGPVPPSSAGADWRPDDLPSLAGIDTIPLDCETRGLRWWSGDILVGLAIGTPNGPVYLPVRHSEGNLDADKVRYWAQRELRGKRIVGAHIQFDAHVMRNFGVDLAEQDCRLTDVLHMSALLDDHQVTNNLEGLAQSRLGYGKMDLPHKELMADYHAADVAPYAKRDVQLVHELYPILTQQIQSQSLEAVLTLEEDALPVTVEMEHNGAKLDEQRLQEWLVRSEADYVACLWELHRITGLNINPNSQLDLRRMFSRCGIPLPLGAEGTPESGKVSFKREYLRRIKHPAIRWLNRARKLFSLRAKFLLRYSREIQLNGRVRYSLNQLRADDDEYGTGGTISGRYSSAALVTQPEPEGVNIQQVAGKKAMAALREDQLEEYRVRDLYMAERGLWLSADAAQIEYRLFAHYAKPPRVIEAYKRDPKTDFHNIVMAMVQQVMASMTRERTKDLNFAKIYGAGLRKIALMIGIEQSEAKVFVDAYDNAFPEAGKLLEYAMRIAEERGYVKTLLGRRCRFPTDCRCPSCAYGPRYHKALNGVIQGSAADINKRKLVELYKERKRLGLTMRFTVHDEVNTDIPEPAVAHEVLRILNTQSFDTCVPILWNVSIGPNWGQCKDIEKSA